MTDFEEAAYLELNPDVAAAVRSGVFASGWEHWQACGRAEGRVAVLSPEARDFDELAYLDANPDILDAVLSGGCRSGLEHWLRSGRAENRPLRPGSDARYLRLNPDLGAAVRAGHISSGLEHWESIGKYEGRPGAPSAYTKGGPVKCSGINYFGFHSAAMGLGAAARHYAEALRALLPVVAFDVPWDIGNVDWQFDDPPHDVNIVHMNPDALPTFLSRYGKRVLPGRYNIAFWVCEVHAGYAEWHALSRVFDEIWTPSQYAASAIRTVSAAPVHVIPHIVDGLPEGPVPSNDAFTFLCIFDLASTLDRKNPLAAIGAFRAAFGKRTDVRLVLKYHHAERDPAAARLLGRLAAAAPNIQAISETWPEDRVYELLRACDCLVSPHRAEGFGLNVAAAMYYGKPVIVTGYSGNMDFTTADNSYLIEYDLVAIRREAGYYKSNYVWADVSEDHLAELLRRVVDHRAEAQAKGKAARETMRSGYSYDSVRGALGVRLTSLRSRHAPQA